jgi:hypothetical protein
MLCCPSPVLVLSRFLLHGCMAISCVILHRIGHEIKHSTLKNGAHDGAVGWGTAPEGRGFDSEWFHWNFSLTSFRAHYGPVFDQTSNRNEYQEYFVGGKDSRCVGLTTLTTFMCRLSWNLGASTSWNPQRLSRPVQGSLYLYLYFKKI